MKIIFLCLPETDISLSPVNSESGKGKKGKDVYYCIKMLTCITVNAVVVHFLVLTVNYMKSFLKPNTLNMLYVFGVHWWFKDCRTVQYVFLLFC